MKRKSTQAEQARIRAQELDDEELRKAFTRIVSAKNTRKTDKRDVRPENAAAAWLLRFAQEKLNDLPLERWVNLRYEIDCFYILDPFSLQLNLYQAHRASDDDFPSRRQEIIKLQSWVATAIRQVFIEGMLPVTLNSFTLILFLKDNSTDAELKAHKEAKEKSTWETEMVPTTLGDSFKYVAFHLLKRDPTRIKACPECKTIFWAAKKLDQKFCRKKCQNKVAMRRHRPPSGRKRGRPRLQQRKQQSKKPRKP